MTSEAFDQVSPDLVEKFYMHNANAAAHNIVRYQASDYEKLLSNGMNHASKKVSEKEIVLLYRL